MQITIVTTMRDEGPFILEWLAHLRQLGVGHVLVYSNDCSDGSDKLLDLVSQTGWLTHIRQDVPKGKSPQWMALRDAWSQPAVQSADWIGVLDVDEFPEIHLGDGGFADLIAAHAGCDAIAMPWRLFGNAGIVGFADRPVTAQFTRCAGDQACYPIATTFFKSLFRRAGPFAGFGVHRPKQKNPAHHGHPVWVDGAGRPLPPAIAHDPKRLSLMGTGPGRSVVDLRHYSLKSIEAFLVKHTRGLPNRSDKRLDLSYWVTRNFNSALAAPLRIADPGWPPDVLQAHEDCVDRYHQKIAAALQDPDLFTLYSQLRMAGPSIEFPVHVAQDLYKMFQKAKAVGP